MSAAPLSTLLSCVHGRDRRLERGIEKADLHTVRALGVCVPNPTNPKNQKYIYGNLCFIADGSGKREVTSFVLGGALGAPAAGVALLPPRLDLLPLAPEDEAEHERCAAALRARPSLCRSHTVLVVDASGSMRTADVARFGSRADAVFGTLALDFVGRQVDAGLAAMTDAVSLVLMRESPTVVFDREPVTNVLFNKFAARIGRAWTADGARGPGCFAPALEAAARLFDGDAGNGAVALSLLFLSDGRPSDTGPYEAAVLGAVSALASRNRGRFSAVMVGFTGREGEDFALMRRMAEAATAAGAHGSFHHACAGSSDGLSVAVSSLVASLSATRTSITQLVEGLALGGRAARVERDVSREAPLPRDSMPTLCKDDEWFLYLPAGVGRAASAVDRLVEWTGEKNGRGGAWRTVPGGMGVAMRRKAFGSGAERVVYQCRKIGERLSSGAVGFGEWLVAKEARFVDDEGTKLKFHEVFCETQKKAAAVAVAYSSALEGLQLRASYRVLFLECQVYVVYEETGTRAGYLVERMLEPRKYKKWNGNAGFVADGRGGTAPMPLLGRRPLADIVEGDSEEEEADESETPPLSPRSKPLAAVHAEDVILAFSHFSFWFSKRKFLVCDLQGELDETRSPQTFFLTDPVIHYASRHRTAVYGRTDHGRKGIANFFDTHVCNAVCKALGFDKYVPI